MIQTRVVPQTLTDWVVLGLVIEEPRHGFSAARELRADGSLGKVWTVHRPLVYRAFEHLHASGLIEPTRVEPGDQGPQRTVFRATRAGRAQFDRWLAHVVEHPRDSRVELLAKFVFLARRGAPLAPLAQRQRAHFAVVSEGLERAASHAVGTDRLIALWRLETIRTINSTLDAVANEDIVVTAEPQSVSA
jgi:DNA-binding PadR family transcriptional regulator